MDAIDLLLVGVTPSQSLTEGLAIHNNAIARNLSVMRSVSRPATSLPSE
jgi:hypothetical protein